MIPADSRYTSAEKVFADAHEYTGSRELIYEMDEFGVPYFDRPVVKTNATLFLMTTSGPEYVPPFKYMMKETDNVTTLAYTSIQDPTKWWVVADVNPELGYPLDWELGDLVNLPE